MLDSFLRGIEDHTQRHPMSAARGVDDECRDLSSGFVLVHDNGLAVRHPLHVRRWGGLHRSLGDSRGLSTLAQGREQCRSVGKAIRGLDGQTALNDRSDAAPKPVPDGHIGSRCGVIHHLELILSVEGRPPREERVEECTEGEDVCPLIRRVCIPKLLGRHVPEGSHGHAHAGQAGRILSRRQRAYQPEVGHAGNGGSCV